MHYISTTHAANGQREWDSARRSCAVRIASGTFKLAPVPAAGLRPRIAVAFHEQASGALRDILFRDAERVRPVV